MLTSGPSALSDFYVQDDDGFITILVLLSWELLQQTFLHYVLHQSANYYGYLKNILAAEWSRSSAI